MKKIVAYLAPEIPGLSTTFVYNEILALEKQGIEVIPFSVKYPETIANSPELSKLREAVEVIYDGKVFPLLAQNIFFALRFPINYFKALCLLFQDIWHLEISSFYYFKLLYQFLHASKLAWYLKKHECEHLHIHFSHTPTQIGMYAVALTNGTFTFTAHANDLFAQGRLLREKVDRSSGVAVISKYNQRFLVENQVDPSKIHIVRCGINTDIPYKERQKKVDQPFIIGSLARLVPKKGMDDLISAINLLHQKGILCKLYIGGDGTIRTDLEALVKKYSLQDWVEFHGVIEHDNVPQWLNQLDVFVLACKTDGNKDKDGIPVVLMEAMASGVPVISTDISGIPELIEPNVSGMLARSGDPLSIAEQIESLLTQTERLPSITAAARKTVIEEFSQQVNLKRLTTLFDADLKAC